MRQLAVGIATVVIVAGGVWMAAAQAPAPPPQKIGFIDVQRVLARSQAGVAAREQLEREKAAMQKEMDTRRVDMEKLREDIEKKGPLMTAEVRREKTEQFERKRRDAARLADDFQKDLEKKEAALLQRVLSDLASIIERVGKQKGYWLVVERSRGGVLYATSEADLTDEIIRAYDQDVQTKGPKK